MPLFVEASRVVIALAPPMFNTPVAPCVTPPEPLNAVVAVIVPLLIITPGFVIVSDVALEYVPLLVYVLVKVEVAIAVVLDPLNVFDEPVKVCAPVLAE